MSKHTHTEWLREGNTVYALNLEGSNRFVAQVQGGWAIQSRVRTDESEIEANARLIAAAPDLLSSLSKKVNEAEQAFFEEWLESKLPSGDHEEVQRKWLNSSDYKEFFVEWGEQITAIAKATGETA